MEWELDEGGLSSPQGKYDCCIGTGECSGDPLTGVRGAISPSEESCLLDERDRIRGRRDTMGDKIDFSREVLCLYCGWIRCKEERAGEAKSTVSPLGEAGAEGVSDGEQV